MSENSFLSVIWSLVQTLIDVYLLLDVSNRYYTVFENPYKSLIHSLRVLAKINCWIKLGSYVLLPFLPLDGAGKLIVY